jgi:hypothetical protein
MFRVIVLSFVICLPFIQVFSQSRCSNDIIEEIEKDDKKGKVTIEQDERIKDLLRRHTLKNCKKQKIPGYRIRIFSDLGADSKDRANAHVAKFYELYGDDIPVYLVYVDPYYKVYVGDFRTRNEAFVFFKKIKSDFPRAFPRAMAVNLPDLK